MINNLNFWFILVIIGFPLAMLTLGEINIKLRQKENKLVRPLASLRNLVLPTFVIYTVLSKIMGLSSTLVPVRLAETVMWIAIIYTALNFLNLFLFEDAPEDTWQANVPKIFLDTARFFLILVGAAIVLSTVWGTDLGSLITALGVGSLVIGLALQDSLGNVFSGVALLFERPFKLDEWIQVGDKIGKVEQITWRSVHLLTESGDLIVVPNSELAKGGIYNYSRPTATYEIVLELDFSCNYPPNKVKTVLTEIALGTDGVLENPPPSVQTFNYGDSKITYKISLYTEDFSYSSSIQERFLTRVWYATKRNGLPMPYPTDSGMGYQSVVLTTEQQASKVKKTLRSVSAISQFDDEKLDLLSRRVIWLNYARGEIVVSEGQTLKGMYLIVEGKALLLVRDISGTEQAIAKVGDGDFFGEKSSLMTEQKSDVTVLALEDMTILLFDKDTIGLMLEHSPRLSSDIGEVMELRRRAIRALQN